MHAASCAPCTQLQAYDATAWLGLLECRPSILYATMNYAALQSQRSDPHHRLFAIKAYIMADGDMDEACALFREMCPEDPPANVAQYIHYWWDALNSRYSLLDVPHGHQSTLTDGTVERCLELVWEGYWSEGYHLAPLHIKDALANIPELAALLEASGVSEETLWAHMRQLEPGLRRRHVVLKSRLTDAHKMARWEEASRLRRWRHTELRRVFWIDATSIHVLPKGYKALVPPDANFVIEDDRLAKDYKHAIVMRFYCCVNAVAGPVAFKFHTGTTKLKLPNKYMVSASAAVPTLALG